MGVASVKRGLGIRTAICVLMLLVAGWVLFDLYDLEDAEIFEVTVSFTIPAPIPAQPIDKVVHDENDPYSTKYFKEPSGSYNRMHYDLRYFQDELEFEERRMVLQDLIKSYLNVTNHYKIETWLAHGTLMGWWWGGHILPWDADIDVQVSYDTLNHLAATMNFTEFRYSFHRSNGQLVNKAYLLDINPRFVDMDRGDGMNIIDARWVDTDNGMYVDITAVRERDLPGQWSCKDYHRYSGQDLWPLKATKFEGIKALVPAKADMLLRGEYGLDSTDRERFSGYVEFFASRSMHFGHRSFMNSTTRCHHKSLLLIENIVSGTDGIETARYG